MRPGLVLLAAAFICAPVILAGSPDSDVDMTLRIEREKEVLAKMQERLKRLQGLDDAAKAPSANGRPLDGVPAAVTEENLKLERRAEDKGLFFDVSARQVALGRVLDALSRTTALPLNVHAQLPRDTLGARVSVELKNIELSELMEILAGTQGIAIRADGQGILVAPLTAVSDATTEDMLRSLAAQAYQEALVRYPRSAQAPEAYLGVARYYRRCGFDEAAAQTAQTILERYPASPSRGGAMLLLGECHEKLGKPEAARAAYYRYIDAFSNASNVPEVLMKIGETWIHQDRWDQGLPIFEEVARQYPQSRQGPLARMRMAECLVHQGRYDLALDHLTRLQESARDDFARRDDLKMVLAECYLQLNKPGQARVCLQQLIESTPNALLAEQAYYRLGDTFLAQWQYLPAMEAYRGAISRFPDGAMRAASHVRLAQAMLGMGMTAAAERELAKLKDEDWKAPAVRALVIELCRKHAELGEAAQVAALMRDTRWTHDASADPELLEIQARAYLNAGVAEKALPQAKAAAQLAVDDKSRQSACLLTGDCYRALNDASRAAMAYGGKVE